MLPGGRKVVADCQHAGCLVKTFLDFYRRSRRTNLCRRLRKPTLPHAASWERSKRARPRSLWATHTVGSWVISSGDFPSTPGPSTCVHQTSARRSLCAQDDQPP
ncbi:hypothetical protein OH76DRAFT_842145 [Lentinus brumalis]|uniref:Uncharacterized protein n=1 Tax=Lentinus brumalis TaxID=2498619 RepID=A0A371D1P4_9APHY|nr:hypothetical protein OH76DRAFT_842145 [Polyporus brumalis]